MAQFLTFFSPQSRKGAKARRREEQPVRVGMFASRLGVFAVKKKKRSKLNNRWFHHLHTLGFCKMNLALHSKSRCRYQDSIGVQDSSCPETPRRLCKMMKVK
jgi:hypothetical protein